MTSSDPLLQPYQLRHLRLKNRIMSTLTADERLAIERSRAAAARGQFASEEHVRTVWAKHGG